MPIINLLPVKGYETVEGVSLKIIEALEEIKEWTKTTYSNPNLLINGDFKVNQRGQESYSTDAAKYSVDRWIIINGIITFMPNGVKVKKRSIHTHGNFVQHIEADYRGKTLTLSAKVDGKIYTATGIMTADEVKWVTVNFDSFSYMRFYATETGLNVVEFIFKKDDPSEHTIEWVKLEEGTAATRFIARTYAEELALCQRYYEVIGTTYLPAVFSGVSGGILFKVEKRVNPTVEVKIAAMVGSSEPIDVDIAYCNMGGVTGVSCKKLQTGGIGLAFSAAFDAEIYRKE